MSLFKRGTSRTSIVVSSLVYVCKQCGHTKVVKENTDESKECPKCGSEMEAISSSSHSEISAKS